MRRISRWFLIAAMLSPAVVTGCGSEQPPVCDSLASVQHSIGQLRDTNVAENGLTQLKTDLQQLGASLDELAGQASAQVAAEVQAVQAAVTQFRTSVTTARADPNTVNLGAVRQAFTAVPAAVNNLGEALAGTC
jgi:outer membrane murein-binding lipoprotein Lpp